MTQTEALARGRGYNAERAGFRRAVEQSRTPREALATNLETLPEFLGGMSVVSYLRIAPGLGPTRARSLLLRIGVDDDAAELRLRDLTCTERVLLAYALRSGR